MWLSCIFFLYDTLLGAVNCVKKGCVWCDFFSGGGGVCVEGRGRGCKDGHAALDKFRFGNGGGGGGGGRQTDTDTSAYADR